MCFVASSLNTTEVLNYRFLIISFPRAAHQLGWKTPSDSDNGVIDVRGEVYINLHDFLDLNEARVSEGQEPLANPRNAASGSLRQLDPEMTRGRRLKFFAYAVETNITSVASELETQKDLLKRLTQWGFKVAEPYSLCSGREGLISFHGDLEARRDSLPFEIDGVVYKINDVTLRATLGQSARAPRWAIAHKFSPEIAETKIEAIEVQVMCHG